VYGQMAAMPFNACHRLLNVAKWAPSSLLPRSGFGGFE
jgi:hypothetical protein